MVVLVVGIFDWENWIGGYMGSLGGSAPVEIKAKVN